jgi:K+-transporting ATPase ATPase C chain
MLRPSIPPSILAHFHPIFKKCFSSFQVASKWAANLKRDQTTVRKKVERIVRENASAPWFGLAGEKIVNVLEPNLELRKRYGVF